MSDMESLGGSLEHLSEIGLKNLVRDLQGSLWDAQLRESQAREEIKELKISDHEFTLSRIKRQNFEKENDDLKAKLSKLESAIKHHLELPCSYDMDLLKIALREEEQNG